MAELIVEMTQEPIELCKLLKIADLVSGGGEAKVVISEGYVSLNGEIEYQKRKKIYHGDVIGFNGDFIQFHVVDELDEPELDQNNSEVEELEQVHSQNAEINSPYNDKENQQKSEGVSKKTSPFQPSNKTKPNKNKSNKNKTTTPRSQNQKVNEKLNNKLNDNKSKRRPISF